MNTKLQDGSLDLGKLVGTVEKMCSTLNSLDVNMYKYMLLLQRPPDIIVSLYVLI